MRGSKKGGLIPLAGHPRMERWVGGEGIENTLAVARAENLRPDTFYFAAGDLGNLSGPADPASRFAHPTLKKEDTKGRLRAVMVQGPVRARTKARMMLSGLATMCARSCFWVTGIPSVS